MPKGYWVAHVTVTDPETYKKYVEAAGPAFTKFNAKFLARGGRCAGPEGPVRPRNVVIEFESYDTALACYNSPEYLAAAKLRQAAGQTDFLIVEGVD
jgi:uncharacterized protein (DUF1330 family)